MNAVNDRLHHVSSAFGAKMKLRPIEWILLVIAVVGGGLAGQTGWERTRLTRDRDRLVQLTGDLTIADPTKLHIRAIETGSPKEFAWRIYVPPHYQQLDSRVSIGGSSSFSAHSSRDFIAVVRFRTDESGCLEVFSRLPGGYHDGKIGDERLAKLLQERWGEIRVEQLGRTEPVQMKSGESAVVLRLSLPAEMQAEARQALAPVDQERFVPTLFEFVVNPKVPRGNEAQSER
jgi:hypothetical protein